ncbi:hypothetical protein Emed_000538 [Eimeria media]
MYVMLCGKLKSDFQQLLDDDHRSTKFRRILIDQCEDSFNANLEPIAVPKDLSPDDAFEFEVNYKKTITGNMIFVGELLKARMISQAILLECIDRLLQKREECIERSGGADQGVHHVEALCAFLLTVGPCFDTPNWRLYGEFCARMRVVESVAGDTTLPFRIRCLMSDVIDTRAAGWRRQGPLQREGPSTLDELHAQSGSHHAASSKDSFRDRGDRQTHASAAAAEEEGGWEVAAGRRGAGAGGSAKTPSNAALGIPLSGKPPPPPAAALAAAALAAAALAAAALATAAVAALAAVAVGGVSTSTTPSASSSSSGSSSSSSSSSSAVLDVDAARDAAKKEFRDLVGCSLAEGLEVFASFQFANQEAQKALLIALFLEAVDKLVGDGDEPKQQRKRIFVFLVALASTPSFPQDTLKQRYT